MAMQATKNWTVLLSVIAVSLITVGCLCEFPETFNLVSPINCQELELIYPATCPYSYENDIVFVWEPAFEGNYEYGYYKVYLDENPIDTENLSLQPVGITSEPEWDVTGILPGKTYYWMVCAVHDMPDCEATIEWSSDNGSFVIPPTPFNLISPINGTLRSHDQDIVFKWRYSDGATEYHLYLDESESPETFRESIRWDEPSSPEWVPSVGFQPAKTYYWMIRAIGPQQGCSELISIRDSNVGYFTTIDTHCQQPEPFDLLMPSDRELFNPGVNVELSWGVSENANEYRVKLYGALESLLFQMSTGNLYLTILGNQLQAGETYSWEVIAISSGDCDTTVYQSARRYFTINEYGDTGGCLPDIQAPVPNPMTWLHEPVQLGSNNAIIMTADIANDDNGVEYLFEETTGNSGGNSSGWQDSPFYTDYGLIIGETYTYTVKARDKSANQNETTPSSPISVTVTGIDTTPPIAGRMSFDMAPHVTSRSAVSMKATTVEDPSGVEYYFQEMSGNPGGSDSSWQDSPEYRNSGLTEGYTYAYRVKARDKSSQRNETLWSYAHSVGFEPSIQLTDTVSPTPNPMTWQFLPVQRGGVRSLSMNATPANDNVTPSDMIKYYFKCISGGGNSSGWQDTPNYIDRWLMPDTMYAYVVKARDEAGNETEWSDPGVGYIDLTGVYGHDIRFHVQNIGDGRIRIGYMTYYGYSVEVRSIALKISLDNAIVSGPQAVLFADPRFNCYMDYANENSEYSFGDGHPFSAVGQAGTADFSLGGLTEVCINMARFDESGTPGPQYCGNLITIQLQNLSQGSATVTISADALRKSSFTDHERLSNLPVSTTVSFE